MEPIILLQTIWGDTIWVPMYLFFGGVATGTYIVAVIADLFGRGNPQWNNVARISSYTALPLFILCGLAITVHLGKPERGILFPFYFTNYGSWMVLGGWALGLSAPFVFLVAAAHYFKTNPFIRRIIGVAGIPILLWMAVNTAMLLSGAQFVPLWSRAHLPWLFVNSGVLSGLAIVGLVIVLAGRFGPGLGKGARGILHIFTYAILLFLILELFELYIFFEFLRTASDAGTQLGEFIIPNGSKIAYEYVVNGPLSNWFWGGVIIVGLGIPLMLSIFGIIIRRWEMSVLSTKFAMIIVGGVLLRFVIVWGGDISAPLHFPPANIQALLGG